MADMTNESLHNGAACKGAGPDGGVNGCAADGCHACGCARHAAHAGGAADDGCAAEAAQLQEMREQLGDRQAVREWFASPLRLWLEYLDGNDARLTPAVAVAAACAPMRDAMVISMVVPPSRWSPPLLLDVAADPASKRATRFYASVLAQAFEARQAQAERARCVRGMAGFRQLAEAVGGRYRGGALVMVAYLSWWLGEPSTPQALRQARQEAPDNRLLAIVSHAMAAGAFPASAGTSRAADGKGGGEAIQTE